MAANDRAYPPHRFIIRKAAELVAQYGVLRSAVRDQNPLALAPAVKNFVIRLVEAKGLREYLACSDPAPEIGYNRAWTLLVRRSGGRYGAVLLPNRIRRDEAIAYLDRADSGFFDRPEDWTDPRMTGLVVSAFCERDGKNAWWWVDDPVAGLVARAAWAADVYEDLAKEAEAASRFEKSTPKTWLDQELRANLVGKRSRRSPAGMDEKREFATDDERFPWDADFLSKIVPLSKRVHVEVAAPTIVPLRIFGPLKRFGIGAGEAVAFWLYADPAGPQATARQVQHWLGLNDSKQVTKMSRDVKAKLTPHRSLMQAVGPWPAGSKSAQTKTTRTAAGSGGIFTIAEEVMRTKNTSMTREAASRIQSAGDRDGDKSFASRAQRAAERNEK